MRWILAAALLVLLLLGAAGWLLYTEPGLRWAAARAQHALERKLELEGLRGALARRMEVASIRYRDGSTAVELTNAVFRLEPAAILAGRVGLRSLRAETLEVTLAAPDEKPRERRRLELPLGLRVDGAQIERITLERGPQRYVFEGFDLRDAVVLRTGAVSASAAFALPHEQYPLAAQLELGGTIDRLEVTFDGRVADVPVSAHAIITPFAPRPLSALEARGGPLDLRRLNAQWPSTALALELSGQASSTDALAGSLSARNAAPGLLDGQRVPLAVLETRFATTDFSSVLLQDLKAALSPGGTLAGSGTLRAGGTDLELSVTDLDLSAFSAKLHPTQLSGKLRLASAEGQTLEGTLSQDGLRISADIVRHGELLEVRSLRAEAHGGAASGSARLRLGEPLRFDAKLRLEHFDPASFGEYPSGDVNGRVDASGTLGAELAVDARWTIQRSTLAGRMLQSRGAARVVRSRITRVAGQASFGGARLTARGDLGRAADRLGWTLEVPRIGEFLAGIEGRVKVDGTLSGSLTEHTVELSARAEGLNLDARLRGGWDKAAGWSGELQTLRNSGAHSMRLDSPVPLRLARGRVELGRVDATFASGRLHMAELRWSENRLRSSGEFSGLPAQWLILATGLTQRMRSTLLLDGQWNIAATPRLTGSASFRRSAGDLTLIEGGKLALGLANAAVDARFADGRIHASAEITSKYATASARADIVPQPGAPGLGITPQSPLVFDAEVGAVDLRAVAQPFLTDARVEGRVSAVLRARNTLAQPAITGTVRGDAIAFEMPPLGVFLRNGRLRAALEGDVLRLTEFSIEGSEGRFSASGSLPLRLADGGAHLAWRAEKFGLLARPDLRLVASGSGEARLVDRRISLSGSLRADRGHFELAQDRLPKLGEDVVIIGREPKQPRARPTRVPLALDLDLDLGEELQVRGYGLEGKLAGQLQVNTVPDGELRVYGHMRTVNASFLAFGQRLYVDPGVVSFDGPLDNPSLEMTAWRRNQPVEVGVQVRGTAQAPSVQLVSHPPVPQHEQLSWLTLGRASADVSKADLGFLMVTAGAVLARGDQLPLNRRIANAFGFDDLTLRGSGEVGDRVVAVGRRLSDRLYVSYEQGLGAAASALVRLDVSLTQRLALRAETGTSSGVGLYYRFSWD